jgi:hypothetical protein
MARRCGRTQTAQHQNARARSSDAMTDQSRVCRGASSRPTSAPGRPSSPFRAAASRRRHSGSKLPHSRVRPSARPTRAQALRFVCRTCLGLPNHLYRHCLCERSNSGHLSRVVAVRRGSPRFVAVCFHLVLHAFRLQAVGRNRAIVGLVQDRVTLLAHQPEAQARVIRPLACASG